jgi:ferric-dicitrate binding protein FerR (iron transport regulator)
LGDRIQVPLAFAPLERQWPKDVLMNTKQSVRMSMSSPKGSIAEQAAQWLVTLRASAGSEEHPYLDTANRNAAFLEWIGHSAAHLLVFMEMVEIERRLERLDANSRAEIRALLEQEVARKRG